jgi:succinyl-CoA synthetase alpha subunit
MSILVNKNTKIITQGMTGTIVSGRKCDAESKIAALETAGTCISPSPTLVGKTLVEVLKG